MKRYKKIIICKYCGFKNNFYRCLTKEQIKPIKKRNKSELIMNCEKCKKIISIKEKK